MQLLCEKLNYQFKNKALLNKALIHASTSVNNNERLEFLGDAVLDCVISSWIFNMYPQATEGELTSFRAYLVKTETLCFIAKYLDLKDHLQINGSTLAKHDLSKSVLADTVEAIFAAIYLDSGFESSCDIITNLYFYTKFGYITFIILRNSLYSLGMSDIYYIYSSYYITNNISS